MVISFPSCSLRAASRSSFLPISRACLVSSSEKSSASSVLPTGCHLCHTVEGMRQRKRGTRDDIALSWRRSRIDVYNICTDGYMTI